MLSILPLLASCWLALTPASAMELFPLPANSFQPPYSEPLPLPDEWILDAQFTSKPKKTQSYNLWVAQGDKSPPFDFDGMQISFGGGNIQTFMNDRHEPEHPQEGLAAVASCQWDLNAPLRIRLEQHSNHLKLSTQQKGTVWRTCFDLDNVRLPGGYALSFQDQPTVTLLDIWQVSQQEAQESAQQHAEEVQHAGGDAAAAAHAKEVLDSLRQLGARMDSTAAKAGSSSGRDSAALEARLTGIERVLADLEGAKVSEHKEMTILREKLDSMQVRACSKSHAHQSLVTDCPMLFVEEAQPHYIDSEPSY